MPLFMRAPICPLCFLTASSRVLRVPRQSHVPAKPYAASRGFRVGRPSKPANGPRPSRMVLSNHVAERDRDAQKPRRKYEGPFAGMNQTTFRGRDGSSPMQSFRPQGASGKEKERTRRTRAMKMQSSLATISYSNRSRTKAQAGGIESFDDFKLLPDVKTAIQGEVLRGLMDAKPTPIQRLAIPALTGQEIGRHRMKAQTRSRREEFLLAAETGSGKTLAYLVPVVNALKQGEMADPSITEYREYFERMKAEVEKPDYTGPHEWEPHPTTARPRGVVLVPTAELVDQVGAVAKSLSHVVKFKAAMFSAKRSADVIHKSLYSPRGIDLIISTPHLLASIAESDPNILSRVSHLVVDEADSLFDRSFSPVTTSILDRALPSVRQLILCSATIPKRLDSFLATQFKDMTRITTPNLHAIPRRVQLGVIDVSKDPYRNNKDLACADAIWTIGKDAAGHQDSAAEELDVKRIMVFVNEREKAQEVADYLVTKGIDAVALHRDTAQQRQSEMLGSFTSREPLTTKLRPVAASPSKKRSLSNTKVIVATDLASRGIDTLAVRHVILYDVPHTTIDFIHRLGRAGRMGRRGRGVVLLGKGDRRDIVAEVRESMYMGQALI